MKDEIDKLDHYDYEGEDPKLEKLNLETYEWKFLLVESLNYKKDSFDTIFEFPIDILTKVERVDEDCENEIWSVILNVWKWKASSEVKDEVINCMLSLKQITDVFS